MLHLRVDQGCPDDSVGLSMQGLDEVLASIWKYQCFLYGHRAGTGEGVLADSGVGREVCEA